MTAKIEIGSCARHVKVSTYSVFVRPDGTTSTATDQVLIAPYKTQTFYPFTGIDHSFYITSVQELSAEEEAKLKAPDDVSAEELKTDRG